MKNRVVLLLLAFFLTGSLHAQYDPSKVNKKAVEAYTRGMNMIDQDQYKLAAELFKEAIRRDPKYIDAYLSLAGIYGQQKNHPLSIQTYEQAFAIDSNYTSDMRLPYSINLAGNGQFDKALKTIDALLARPKLGPATKKAAEYRRKTFQFALDFIAAHPDQYIFTPRNLGDGVNTSASEYFPTLPIEGDQLIFTRVLDNRNEDFFLSNRNGDQWAQAYRLTGSINTPENEGAQNVSQDGRWLVFTGCHREEGLGSCDIYISFLTNKGWSEAVNLGAPVNSREWDSQPSLSPDKRDLYFASRRPGGFGGSDIWVSHLLNNGKWTEPENLGPTINTSGEETEPFIHADNHTLYFASNGLPGYGGEDLFLTRRGTDGKWMKPENLGYPINTINNDATLVVAADGKTAYFSSDRTEGKGGLDLYSFEMRPDMRPARTFWVKGKVFDQKTTAGLPSSVELIDMANGATLSNVRTDETGNYLVTLPVGKDYIFSVTRKGYLFYSDRFSLKDKAPDSTYKKDIPLQPIEVNASIVLKNIFFDVNQYVLKPESRIELDRVVQLLRENPTVRIQLEGHTDNVGKASDNQRLSEQRARAVVKYLVDNGVPPVRLTAKGFGATIPVASNNDEAGRAQNRRTALKVTAQ